MFWLCWVFTAAYRLSLVTSGSYSPLLGAQASVCGGFSCCGAQAAATRAAQIVARRFRSCSLWTLEHWFSSCGSRVQLLHGMWDLPGPGIKTLFPALAGRFLFTPTREVLQFPYF